MSQKADESGFLVSVKSAYRIFVGVNIYGALVIFFSMIEPWAFKKKHEIFDKITMDEPKI